MTKQRKRQSEGTMGVVKAQVTLCPYMNFPEGIVNFPEGIVLTRFIARVIII